MFRTGHFPRSRHRCSIPAIFAAARRRSIPPQSSSAPDRYPAQALPPPAAAAGPPPSSIQAQPLPPPPGATSAPAVSNRVIAPQTGSLNSSNQTIVPQQSQPGQGAGPGLPGANPPPQPADTVTAARRHRDHRNADAKNREFARGIFRARQDHRPHHQLRCRHWRNGAVRRAAGDGAGLLHAPSDRSDQHRCVRPGRRSHASGRGQAHLLGLDVRRQSGPACGRASDLRCLADRLRFADQGRRTIAPPAPAPAVPARRASRVPVRAAPSRLQPAPAVQVQPR